jgi:hypothetical protein
MAKSTRPRGCEAAPAPEPAPPGTPPRPPVSRRYIYTPELLADGRRRYEQTDHRVIDIAADFGIHPTTFQRMANREHWVRYVPPPRDLSPSARLAAEAAALEAALSLPPAEPQAPPVPDSSPPGDARMRTGDEAAAALPPTAATIDRLHRVVLAVHATVEAMRARMKAEPETPAAADVTARTLARHTQILQTLQRMRCGLPGTEAHDRYDDDMPADIDAFRDALARRIEAFMASRTDEECGLGDDAAGDDAPRP